jgi:hypothetical protein
LKPHKKITILGPGDPVPDDGLAILWVDDQLYSKSSFESLAQCVESGENVIANEDGFRLNQSAIDRLENSQNLEGHILFFATDDTHVNTFLRIAPQCRQYTFVVHKTLNLGGREALEKRGESWTVHERSMGAFHTANIALVGNDNGKEERVFIHHCRQHNIPVMSLQEAINLDFDGPAMRWADRTFIGGIHALQYHARSLTVLTGNPRYDDLRAQAIPQNPYVLINCNFTFGVASDWARDWLDQAIQAAEDAGLEYRVTVHPRDETDLKNVDHLMPSGAHVVHEQIAGAFVLVSRDSSLPYEALLTNRHVVYFNPFDETERCLNEDSTGLISKCDSRNTLASLLKTLRHQPLPIAESDASKQMFQYYYTGIDGRNYLRVVRALQTFLDHDYQHRRDALSQSYFVAYGNMILQNVIRPKLRNIRVLRAAWRFVKYTILRRSEG